MVTNLENKYEWILYEWHDKGLKLMSKLLWAKSNQCFEFKNSLIKTKDAAIRIHSKHYYWGTPHTDEFGKYYDGENHLAIIMMTLRDGLQQNLIEKVNNLKEISYENLDKNLDDSNECFDYNEFNLINDDDQYEEDQFNLYLDDRHNEESLDLDFNQVAHFGDPHYTINEEDCFDTELDEKSINPNKDLDEPVLDKSVFNDNQLTELRQILDKNKDAFIPPSGKLGKCKLIQMKIRLKEGYEPSFKKPYRMSPDAKREFQKHVDRYLENGVITPVNSEWNSPVMIVPKEVKRSHAHMASNKPQRFRMVVDLRGVNAQIRHDTKIVPNMEDILDQLGGSYDNTARRPTIFSVMDISDSFYQLELDQASTEITAFIGPQGNQYGFLRCPMGLSTSPGILVKVMREILGEFLNKFVINYMDDVLIYSPDAETHLHHIDLVLQAFAKANLLLLKRKCQLGMKQADFLGFQISNEGLSPSSKHIAALREYQPPTTRKQVRRFLGLVNFFRKFIPDRSKLLLPLLKLTRKNTPYQWTQECQNAFTTVINILTTRPVLKFPDFNSTFYLTTDSSSTGLGAALFQIDEEKDCFAPVAFYARALTKHEKNYPATKLELLGVHDAIKHFRVYLGDSSKKFVLFTDCSAIKGILTKTQFVPQLARFALALQSYNFDIYHVKGTTNFVSDGLSRSKEILQQDKASEFMSKQTIEYSHDPSKIVASDSDIDDFERVNALYRLDVLQQEDMSDEFENVFNPSYIIDEEIDESCCTVNAWKVPSNRYDLRHKPHRNNAVDTVDPIVQMPTADEIENTEQNKPIEPISLTRFKNQAEGVSELSDINDAEDKVEFATLDPESSEASEFNDLTDRKVVSDDTMDLVLHSIGTGFSANSELSKEVFIAEQQKDEFSRTMIQYIQTGVLDEQLSDDFRKHIQSQVDNYIFKADLLFKIRGSTSRDSSLPPLLFYVPKTLTQTVIQYIHTLYDSHWGVAKTLLKLKALFYWKLMDKEVKTYIGSCHHCLSNKRNQHNMNPPIHLFEPCNNPFERVVIDLLGPLPLTKNRNSYVGVVVDDFSRYLIAFPMKSKTCEEFSTHFFYKVICVYGSPTWIHSDRGSEFLGQIFQNLLKSHSVKQTFNSANHPTSSGLSEASVKRIISMFRTMMDTTNSWDSLLPQAVFAINSTPSAYANMSPHLLLFNWCPRQPLHFLSEGEIREWKNRSELVQSICKMQEMIQISLAKSRDKYRSHMIKYGNQHKSNIQPVPGNIVYIKMQKAEVQNKLAPLYQGPYMVTELLDNYRVKLRDLQTNRPYLHPMHISRLKLAQHYDYQVADRINRKS